MTTINIALYFLFLATVALGYLWEGNKICPFDTRLCLETTTRCQRATQKNKFAPNRCDDSCEPPPCPPLRKGLFLLNGDQYAFANGKGHSCVFYEKEQATRCTYKLANNKRFYTVFPESEIRSGYCPCGFEPNLQKRFVVRLDYNENAFIVNTDGDYCMVRDAAQLAWVNPTGLDFLTSYPPGRDHGICWLPKGEFMSQGGRIFRSFGNGHYCLFLTTAQLQPCGVSTNEYLSRKIMGTALGVYDGVCGCGKPWQPGNFVRNFATTEIYLIVNEFGEYCFVQNMAHYTWLGPPFVDIPGKPPGRSHGVCWLPKGDFSVKNGGIYSSFGNGHYCTYLTLEQMTRCGRNEEWKSNTFDSLPPDQFFDGVCGCGKPWQPGNYVRNKGTKAIYLIVNEFGEYCLVQNTVHYAWIGSPPFVDIPGKPPGRSHGVCWLPKGDFSVKNGGIYNSFGNGHYCRYQSMAQMVRCGRNEEWKTNAFGKLPPDQFFDGVCSC